MLRLSRGQLRGMPLDLFHKLPGLLWPKQRHHYVKDVGTNINEVVRNVAAWTAYDYVWHGLGDGLRVHPAAQYFDGASHVPYDLSNLIPRRAGPSKILHYEYDVGIIVIYDRKIIRICPALRSGWLACPVHLDRRVRGWSSFSVQVVHPVRHFRLII